MRTCLPSARTMTSPSLIILAAGASDATASTSAPSWVGIDVVPGLLQGDCRRDLLRPRHLGEALVEALLEGGAGWDDLDCR